MDLGIATTRNKSFLMLFNKVSTVLRGLFNIKSRIPVEPLCRRQCWWIKINTVESEAESYLCDLWRQMGRKRKYLWKDGGLHFVGFHEPYFFFLSVTLSTSQNNELYGKTTKPISNHRAAKCENTKTEQPWNIATSREGTFISQKFHPL